MKKNYVVMDGNTAAAYASYAFTEVAAIFPITPSSVMAEKVDEWAAKGKKNIFGNTVDVIQMQSEAGAAGTCHGSLQAGALTTTYTASQGLLLMIPPMFKIGGEFLPGVFHIAARTVSAHALSIFGDHSDVMACRSTGFGMIMSSSPQEVMDLGAVSHLSAIGGRYAFMHVFDGFRTSHEMQRIEALDYDELKKLVDYDQLNAFRKNALNPEHPYERGTTVNPDIFFQCKEGANEKIASIPGVVQYYMDEINKLTGRDYKLFNYYGAPDAEEVVVVMCSAAETVRDTVDYLNAQGKKVGMVQVHLYRPFSVQHFTEAIPATCKKVAVLDRTKESGSIGEPLYLDVQSALIQAGRGDIVVVGGRYGLASKDTTPAQIAAVYTNLEQAQPKNNFTIGIVDDVTNTSLTDEPIKLSYEGQTAAKIWGLGGDGTVGANKNAITIIGLTADKYAQAYFSYDSMKTGGLTQSHLRFGDQPIHATYLVDSADFVGCHAPTYVHKYDTTAELKDGGVYLLNCPWTAEELETQLPAKMKRDLYNKHAQFYTIDATKLAGEIGLGERVNTILQAAFFELTKVIPIDMAVEAMKKGNYDSYFKKGGQEIVDKNNKAVDAGIEGLVKVEVPASWADAVDTPKDLSHLPEFIQDIVEPMNRQQGDFIPVSVFKKHDCFDGTWPLGTTEYSKRGVAIKVPRWNAEVCAQCNSCSMACPHAAIRPVLLTDEELAGAPESFVTVKAKGAKLSDYNFRLQVSPYDCLGCGVCVSVCPLKDKGALTMVPMEEEAAQQDNFNRFVMDEQYLKKEAVSDKTVKELQFAKPYFQFSPACAGCAETTYIKTVTQLFGSRMYVANASGCSSAYGGSLPTTPYCTDNRGFGPCWEQSLFEDNAEFAYGFFHAQDVIQQELRIHLNALKEQNVAVEAIDEYLAHYSEGDKSREVTDALIAALEQVPANEDVAFVLQNKEYLAKKSVWAFGGDGWAYDIGFGGIDHVIAQNRDVNILVMDTEVYSNTGGQSSKATPTAAVAKFAAGGKQVKKKDLGAIAMTYGYVYVAQVAMGYNQAQTLRALREAEAYPGPSIVIAYCPCLEHGIKAGMGATQLEMKKAVECGYWHLYRYDPRLAAEGKNPFQLDSPEPDSDKMVEYLRGENRYNRLQINFPERAEALYEKTIREAKERYAKYAKMAGK
ncbi:pyruvate:ferredoxin (flavodoxin) oxidoreductase [uncultured Megasphaera sp.]|uniref:pyruvate:ferredoxin (flavodoxin) oxidoreductase n=1 Tax=uncultured Megasphaera sp. TaxID=165188 RepID=UPI00265CA75A|nr:pyruvate:ferredoxin (flavodoxin) oxidoreductase [uncultured Megasphaera sp.]